MSFPLNQPAQHYRSDTSHKVFNTPARSARPIYRIFRSHRKGGRRTHTGIAGPNRAGSAGRRAHRTCHHHPYRERWDGDHHSEGAVHRARLACRWLVPGAPPSDGLVSADGARRASSGIGGVPHHVREEVSVGHLDDDASCCFGLTLSRAAPGRRTWYRALGTLLPIFYRTTRYKAQHQRLRCQPC